MFIKKMKKVNFKEQISAIKATRCSNYFTLLRERVDYAYSIKKVNRFGDFLLEGRVIALDIQKDKNIFMCKMSVDPMGIKWVDFSTATYLPKLFQIFFIRSRRWNCRVVSWRSFIWSEVSIKQTKKLLEAEQRELKKNMNSYYEEYGHYELFDQKIQKLEDSVTLEGESATNREKVKKFKLKNKIVTRTSIYTYRKKKKKIKTYRGYRKDKFTLRIFSMQNLTRFSKNFIINLRSRGVFFPGLRRFTFPTAGSKFFYPCSTRNWVKHKDLSLQGFIKIYNTVFLLPSYTFLAGEQIRLKSAGRKQASLNNYFKTSFFSNWLSWNLLFITKPFFGKEDSKDTKKLVYLLAVKLSKIRIYNKISRVFLKGFGGLGHYDLLRRLVGVVFSSPFELFVVGCILNPENNELRSQLPFGNYTRFIAYVFRSRWKWIPKLFPILLQTNRFYRITTKKKLKSGLSVRFRIILLLRKELSKNFNFYKSCVNRLSHLAINFDRFEWNQFLSALFNRLTAFKQKNELLVLKRNKQVRAVSLVSTFVKKLEPLIANRVLNYFVCNKQFFQVVSCFLADFAAFTTVMAKNTGVKTKYKRIFPFRRHGVVVGNTFNEVGAGILQQKSSLVSLSLLKEIVSARSQFCAFSYPKDTIKLFKKKYYQLLSNLCILDFVSFYKNVIVSTIKFNRPLKRVSAKVKPTRKLAARSQVKRGSKKIPRKYFVLLRKTSLVQGNSANLSLLLKLLKKNPKGFEVVDGAMFSPFAYESSSRGRSYSAKQQNSHSGLLKVRFPHLRRFITSLKKDFNEDAFNYAYLVKVEPIFREFLQYKKELKAARKAYFKKKYAKRYYSRGYNNYKNKHYKKRYYKHNHNNKNYWNRHNNYNNNNNNRNNHYSNRNNYYHGHGNATAVNVNNYPYKSKPYRNTWGKPYFANSYKNNYNSYRYNNNYNNYRNNSSRNSYWRQQVHNKFNGSNTRGATWNNGHKKYLETVLKPGRSSFKKPRFPNSNKFLVPVEHYQPRKRSGTYLNSAKRVNLVKKKQNRIITTNNAVFNQDFLFDTIPPYIKPLRMKRVHGGKVTTHGFKNKKSRGFNNFLMNRQPLPPTRVAQVNYHNQIKNDKYTQENLKNKGHNRRKHRGWRRNTSKNNRQK